jgi:hypothetical protein
MNNLEIFSLGQKKSGELQNSLAIISHTPLLQQKPEYINTIDLGSWRKIGISGSRQHRKTDLFL